jgi:hypothetical protein
MCCRRRQLSSSRPCPPSHAHGFAYRQAHPLQHRARPADPHTAAAHTPPPPAPRLAGPQVSSRRLCTEAMLQVLKQEIRKGRSRGSLMAAETELVISEPLGRGGFGHVYRGTWHTAQAAIKVGGPRGWGLGAGRQGGGAQAPAGRRPWTGGGPAAAL